MVTNPDNDRDYTEDDEINDSRKLNFYYLLKGRICETMTKWGYLRKKIELVQKIYLIGRDVI